MGCVACLQRRSLLARTLSDRFPTARPTRCAPADTERKLFCQTLAKLYVPEECDAGRVKESQLLISALKKVRRPLSRSPTASPAPSNLSADPSTLPSSIVTKKRPIEDTVSRNALGRFATALEKRFGKLKDVGRPGDDEEGDDTDGGAAADPQTLEQAQARVEAFLDEWCVPAPGSRGERARGR